MQRSRDFRESAAAELFVQFGDFARQAGGTVAKDFARFGDDFVDAVGRFVKDDGAVFDAEALDGAFSFATAGRQKTDKKKFFIRQTGSGKRGEQSAGTGNGNNRNFVAETKRDEAMAGVGNERHTGIADEGDFGALFHGKDEFGGAGHFIVLVVADERLLNIVMIEKF